MRLLEIRQEIDRSEESRYDYRLHGVLLAANARLHRGFAGLCDGDVWDSLIRGTRGSGFVWHLPCLAIRKAVVITITSGTIRCWPSF